MISTFFFFLFFYFLSTTLLFSWTLLDVYRGHHYFNLDLLFFFFTLTLSIQRALTCSLICAPISHLCFLPTALIKQIEIGNIVTVIKSFSFASASQSAFSRLSFPLHSDILIKEDIFSHLDISSGVWPIFPFCGNVFIFQMLFQCIQLLGEQLE